MADVQLEDGFIRLANRLAEALMVANLSATHLKIVLCLLRLTYGWQRLTVRASRADIADRCGLKLSGGFRAAFDDLKAENVIVEIQAANGRIPGAYMVNKNYEDWGRYSIPIQRLESLFRDRLGSVDRVPLPVEGARGYVYYARDDEQVKIGFSADPWSRILDMRTARPTVELVAIEVGDRQLETERHRQFASARLHDRREWFGLTKELEKHILGLDGASVRAPTLDEAPALVQAPKEVLTASVREDGCLPEGIVTHPKATDGIELQGRKERKDSTTKEKQQQQQRTAADEPSTEAKYGLGITTAANKAISKKWGEQPHPLYYGLSTQLAADLVQMGVPLPIAQSSIAYQVERSKNTLPPHTIEYFRNGILKAAQSDEQKALDSTAEPVLTSSPSLQRAEAQVESTVKMLAETFTEREMLPKYESERDRAVKLFAENPGNAVRLAAITTAAETANAFLGPKWVARAIATALSTAAEFPTFEVWLAARQKAQGVPRGTSAVA